jgi:hypothetical protein
MPPATWKWRNCEVVWDEAAPISQWAPRSESFATLAECEARRAEVVRRCGLRIEDLRPFTRCLRCNEPTVPAAKAEIERQVPEYVWETQESFSRCPRCGRVYWRGTHTERALATIRQLFE